jgi:hypothetical protein
LQLRVARRLRATVRNARKKNDLGKKPGSCHVDGARQPTASHEGTAVIKHHIAQRTAGRVEKLAVELINDCVVIHGIVPCYYVKQLVLQAALDLGAAEGAKRVELRVQVVCCPKNPPHTH